VARPDSLDSLFLHDGPWTEEAFFALPVDPRVELVDGSLLVSPSSRPSHHWLSHQLCGALNAARPRGVRAIPGVNVRVGPGRILIPDIAVLENAELTDLYLVPVQVRMVVEIGSPSTSRYDRTVKAQLYAEAGIPTLLRVEHGEPVVGVLHTLREGAYVETARGSVLTLTDPFPVTLDLESLAAAD
jgi:Uma2 family endonuclease